MQVNEEVKTISHTTPSEFTEYEQFLTAELPGHVKHKITARVGAILDHPGSTNTDIHIQIETLKREVIGMVRDAQLELFQIYCDAGKRSTRAAVQVPTVPAPAAVPAPESITGRTNYSERDRGFYGDILNKAGDDLGIIQQNLLSAPAAAEIEYFNFVGFNGVVFDLGILVGTTGPGMPMGYDAVRW